MSAAQRSQPMRPDWGVYPAFSLMAGLVFAVIWAASAVLIPNHPRGCGGSVLAFGFVSAFVITSTTVYFVRADALRERTLNRVRRSQISPDSPVCAA